METKAKLQKLKFALGQTRRQVDEALQVVDGLEADLHPSFLQWRCDGCGYMKHFTRPSTVLHVGSVQGAAVLGFHLGRDEHLPPRNLRCN